MRGGRGSAGGGQEAARKLRVRVQAVGGASCGVSTVWSTGRACATPDAELVLQSDRDMVHLCGGSRLWATDTVKTFKSDGICEVVDAKQCDAAVP